MTRLLTKSEHIPYPLLLLADETLDAINKYINNSEIYVLEQDNITIAVYVLQGVSPDTIEIKNIAVDKLFQGQGIGRKLLYEAIARAKERGYQNIIIGTGDASIGELNLYQKVGFEIYDIKHRFFLDNYPEPIYENGIQLRHMIMLRKVLE